jgi:AraC family transcriptional regulator
VSRAGRYTSPMPVAPPLLPLPARTEYLVAEGGGASARCAEAAYPAGLRIGVHAHERLSLTAIAAGGFDELAGARGVLACGPGSVVLRPRGHAHANAVGRTGARDLEVEFDRRVSETLPAAWTGADTVVLRHPRADAAVRAIRRELRATDGARSLVLEGLALELLGTCVRARERDARGPVPRWLVRVRERIEAGFHGPLRFERLAEEVGVHPVHLARAFRAHYGDSPGAWLRRLRVRFAADELRRRPDRPLSEIAAAAGFSDHSHFARVFRAETGETPSRWRARS